MNRQALSEGFHYFFLKSVFLLFVSVSVRMAPGLAPGSSSYPYVSLAAEYSKTYTMWSGRSGPALSNPREI
jgi:hypothetical protein